MEHKLKISIWLWLSLLSTLKKRGYNKRESGAFLLAKKGSNKIVKYIAYDDLDPDCLTGMIEFNQTGFTKLWNILRESNMHVVADVHTHPGNWTGQSDLDIANPMISIPGHIGIIIPNYASQPLHLKKGIGLYKYLGNYEWETLSTKKLNLSLI